MSDVLLPIARDVSTGEILHISDAPARIPKDYVLLCPFCEGRVFRRAGSRKPHFYHKPKNDCAVSRETLLHEGAKYFIHDRLSRDIEFKIYVDTSSLDTTASRELLDSLGIHSFSISSKSIFTNTGYQHTVEKSIGSFRPDILSSKKTEFQELQFAWEVFVSHELEEDKVASFKKDGIGFVFGDNYPVRSASIMMAG